MVGKESKMVVMCFTAMFGWKDVNKGNNQDACDDLEEQDLDCSDMIYRHDDI